MPRKRPTAQNKEMQARIAAKFGKTSSRTGGRGSVRRKFKAPPKSSMQDDKRLQGQLKKLNVNPIPAIEEVNLFKDDGTVVHFTKPKVQAEISSNTYVISGQCETKKLEELIPAILPQLGREHIDSLKNFANAFQNMQAPDADDDVPVLVDDNFEAVASSDQKNADASATGADADATDKNEKVEANGDASKPADTANAGDNADTPNLPAATEETDANDVKKTENNENTNETTDNTAAAATATKEEAKPTSLKPDKDAEVSV